jgi:hypothetical protein
LGRGRNPKRLIFIPDLKKTHIGIKPEMERRRRVGRGGSITDVMFPNRVPKSVKTQKAPTSVAVGQGGDSQQAPSITIYSTFMDVEDGSIGDI